MLSSRLLWRRRGGSQGEGKAEAGGLAYGVKKTLDEASPSGLRLAGQSDLVGGDRNNYHACPDYVSHVACILSDCSSLSLGAPPNKVPSIASVGWHFLTSAAAWLFVLIKPRARISK